MQTNQALFVKYAAQRYEVASLRDAQILWCRFRDTSGGGASEVGNGIVVTNSAGKRVARVSYNGRLWDAKNQPMN